MSNLTSLFEIPEGLEGLLRSGLAAISTLDHQSQKKLFAWARAAHAARTYGDSNAFVSETGLSAKHADRLQIAVVTMVDFLRESTITSEEFIEAGLESSTFTEAEVPGLKRFAELVIATRVELKRESDLSKLQNIVLPTLMEFELTLDARVQVGDGKVTDATPVVIAYIDTDSENQVAWFQMNERRVREVRDKLSTILNEIDALREWIKVSIQGSR